MMIKVFSITLWIITKHDDKNLHHYLLVSNFTSSDLTENFRSNKMTVKGFSITLWKCIEIQKIAYFCNFGTFSCVFNVSSGCHYCQSDLVVIEFTGRGLRTRKESKSSGKASDFDSFLVLGPPPVNYITTKSDWQ